MLRKNRNLSLLAAALIGVFFLVVALSAKSGSPRDRSGQWPIAGHDLDNSRSQPSEKKIGTDNLHQLVPKWVFTTGSDVSATPTVAGNAVYFPDWAGNLYAVRADTGKLLWSHTIADYNGRPGSVSRVSPAIYNDELIIGDNTASSVTHNGPHLIGL